jgi:hypothetical protein
MTLITKSSLLGGDHVLPAGIEEGVVRGFEHLAGSQIPGTGELPDDVAGGIHLE